MTTMNRMKSDAMKRILNDLYGNSIYGTASKDRSITMVFPNDDILKDTMRITNKNNLEIKKVIFNAPATIVYWSDDTKTVVKAGEHDIFDPEKGLAMAIAKKFFGNKGNYYNHFAEWLPVDYIPTKE